MYQERNSSSPPNNNIYSTEKKQMVMNGRVPATRRDGRKLFVGGLPNEGMLCIYLVFHLYSRGIKLGFILTFFTCSQTHKFMGRVDHNIR